MPWSLPPPPPLTWTHTHTVLVSSLINFSSSPCLSSAGCALFPCCFWELNGGKASLFPLLLHVTMLPQISHFNLELNCLSLNLTHLGVFSPYRLPLSLSPFYHCHLRVCDRHWMFGMNSWVNTGITLETAERWPYWCVPPFWALNPHALWEIWKL